MKKILVFILVSWTSSIVAQSKFQKYFDSFAVKGSTTIYNYKSKEWIFTDIKDADVVTLPASTFKIPNSLIALEYKAIQDENEVFKWDGETKSHLGTVINAWNKDTDLKNAYKNSTVWLYVDVAKRVGRKTYQRTLKKLHYGNGNLTEKGIDFWNYGEFSISPRNQIQFLIKLYEGNLPFSRSTINKVKEIMISEKTASHMYRDKTGWTRKNGIDIGWWVGYLETNDNVFFFATRLQKDEQQENPNFPKARREITKLILNEVMGQ
ncbi:MAG: class D beta-lactamase [Chitinophagaceae bacterium]|nr:class D beta-lactamase [Chitinophagaceae bacterium]